MHVNVHMDPYTHRLMTKFKSPKKTQMNPTILADSGTWKVAFVASKTGNGVGCGFKVRKTKEGSTFKAHRWICLISKKDNFIQVVVLNDHKKCWNYSFVTYKLSALVYMSKNDINDLNLCKNTPSFSAKLSSLHTSYSGSRQKSR